MVGGFDACYGNMPALGRSLWFIAILSKADPGPLTWPHEKYS